MKRLLFLVALLLPHCTGCVAFAYPTIAMVPDLKVDNRDGGAHAFRVDVDQTLRATKYTLSRIPIDPRGQIAGQLEIAPATGVINPFGLTGVTEERNNYTMLVRIYRPGYQTIEVPAWDKTRELQWLAATGLEAQEKALDDLLADRWTPAEPRLSLNNPSPPSPPQWSWQVNNRPPSLLPGSASSMHRKSLLFVVSEYGRLANGSAAKAPGMESTRERLQQKAIWLNRWADEAPKQP